MTAPIVLTIFVRHTPTCKYRGDEFSKRCNCRKHLRWTSKGEQHRKTAGTRSWAEAEVIKRDMEDQLSGRAETTVVEAERSLGDCVKIFVTDKRVQGISKGSIEKYTRELGRLVQFCERQNVFAVQLVTRELLTGYCAEWAELYPSTTTRASVRDRTRAFLRYCYEAQWIPRVPATPKIIVDEPPTMPLMPEEYDALLLATSTFRDEATRLRAHTLFQTMRWTGLAVGDALRLPRASLKLNKETKRYGIITSRQKTGTHVSVALPDTVAEALLALPKEWTVTAGGVGHLAKITQHAHADYFFWDGQSDIVNTWTRKIIPRVFEASKIVKAGNMTSHRLRDTFAVDLLEKGVALQDVSKLLGHTSIKTTERHYAKWVKGRQDRLDDIVALSWGESKILKARSAAPKKAARVAA